MSDVLMSLRGPVGRRDAESALRNRAEWDPQRAQAYERYVLFFCNNLYTLKQIGRYGAREVALTKIRHRSPRRTGLRVVASA